MRIDHVKAGMVLAEDVIDEHGQLLLEKGILLSEVYLARMKQLGIVNLPIADAYASSLKTDTAITDQLREELSLCFRALFHLKSEEMLAQKLRNVYIRQLNSTVDSVITELANQLPRIVNVQVRAPSATEVEHAVNVCLLSVITGLYLKFPRSVLQELALGALLHDIGKSLVPQTSSRQTAPYFHCQAGQDLLLRTGVGSAIARIAAEHHEAHDGSGFPAGLSGSKIHPLSRIVAVANYFDAALQESATTGAPRHEVMERLLASGNSQFDLTVLRAFCHTVALYPIGSLIRLSSNEQAYVIENQPQYPLRPIIRIFRDHEPVTLNLVFKPHLLIEELIQE